MGLGEITGPPIDDRSIEGLGWVAGSCKMEEFSFAVLHDEASINEDFGYNIIATEEKERG